MDDDYGVGPSTAPTRSRVSSRIQPPPPPPHVPVPSPSPAPTKSKPRQGSQVPLAKPSKPVIRTGRGNVQSKQTKSTFTSAANRKQTKRSINADASDSDKSIQAKSVKRVRLTLPQNGSSTPAEVKFLLFVLLSLNDYFPIKQKLIIIFYFFRPLLVLFSGGGTSDQRVVSSYPVGEKVVPEIWSLLCRFKTGSTQTPGQGHLGQE